MRRVGRKRESVLSRRGNKGRLKNSSLIFQATYILGNNMRVDLNKGFGSLRGGDGNWVLLLGEGGV